MPIPSEGAPLSALVTGASSGIGRATAVELAGRGIAPAASSDRDGQREQAKMLKRIRELEMENEILRKAAAYLSQANLRIGAASPK